MGKTKDIAGQTFGLLTAIRPLRKERGRVVWEFKCSCGKTVENIMSPITSGAVQSCGHLQKEGARQRMTAMVTKHGMTGTPTHSTWAGMHARCRDEGHTAYAFYGGRGIKVCERWSGENGFTNFLADVGERPGPDWSIDREDPDKDYEPGNCKWIPESEEGRHRRSTRWIEYKGEKKPLTEWADSVGLRRETLAHRLDAGWSVEEAMETPPKTGGGRPKQPHREPVTIPDVLIYEGEELPLLTISKRSGVNYSTLYQRLRRGMTVEEAASLPVRGKSPAGTNGNTKSGPPTEEIRFP